jgi:hypothetical protein
MKQKLFLNMPGAFFRPMRAASMTRTLPHRIDKVAAVLPACAVTIAAARVSWAVLSMESSDPLLERGSLGIDIKAARIVLPVQVDNCAVPLRTGIGRRPLFHEPVSNGIFAFKVREAESVMDGVSTVEVMLI